MHVHSLKRMTITWSNAICVTNGSTFVVWPLKQSPCKDHGCVSTADIDLIILNVKSHAFILLTTKDQPHTLNSFLDLTQLLFFSIDQAATYLINHECRSIHRKTLFTIHRRENDVNC